MISRTTAMLPDMHEYTTSFDNARDLARYFMNPENSTSGFLAFRAAVTRYHKSGKWPDYSALTRDIAIDEDTPAISVMVQGLGRVFEEAIAL